jgi:hypothetical protein
MLVLFAVLGFLNLLELAAMVVARSAGSGA